MQGAFQRVTIGESTIHVSDGNYSSKYPKAHEFLDAGVPFVSANNLRSGRITKDNLKYISEAQHASLKKGHIQVGDVLLVTRGSLGLTALVTQEFDDANINAQLVLLRADNQNVDASFLFFVANSPDFQGQVIGNASGTAQPQLPIGPLKRISIPLPPLPIQRRIAGILSAYDDLIENSQRRIKILEAMARALYREALRASTQSPVSLPIIKSPYWRFISENGGIYIGTKRYYATADIDGLEVTGVGVDYSFADKPSRAQKQPIPSSVWFARMKDTYKIAWYEPVNNERVSGVILSSGFAGFQARDPELWPLLFLTLSSKEFHVQKDLYCTGATQMSLTNEGLARITLPLPDEQAARRLGQYAGPMLNAISGLQQRNENLRRTRDLLLPRLLSGQIDVEAMPS